MWCKSSMISFSNLLAFSKQSPSINDTIQCLKTRNISWKVWNRAEMQIYCWTKAYLNSFHDDCDLYANMFIIYHLYILYIYLVSTDYKLINHFLHLLSFLLAMYPAYLHFCHLIILYLLYWSILRSILTSFYLSNNPCYLKKVRGYNAQNVMSIITILVWIERYKGMIILHLKIL